MRVAMNDRRLAFCVPSLSNGGAERAMATLASECVELGWDVDMILLGGKDVDYADELSPRVHVVDLHQKHAWTSVPALWHYLRQRRPAALFSTISLMNCVAAAATRLAHVRTRLVLREADTMLEYSGTIRFLASILYRGADSIVAVSGDVKKDLVLKARLPKEHICVIRNSVDVNHVRQLAHVALPTPFPADDVPVILGVGRLEPQKDFATLLRAFAAVRADRPCHLIILGRGSQLVSLRRLANDLGITDSVAFPGFVQNPYAWMARSRVFVLSSVHEGCPNVLLQALACDCSIVATDAPGDARFLLQNGGVLGHLVPVGAWREMAQAIRVALDEHRTASTIAAIDKWLEKFDLRSAAVAYLAAAGLPDSPGVARDTP
jgi:glycosyltransferase involved in cell wall biosynthesis